MCKHVLIALGSNKPSFAGTSLQTVSAAIEALSLRGFSLLKVSRFYKTPSFPEGSGPDFVNAAISARTELSPEGVLEALNDIEQQFARTRRVRWGPRTLDLDLLAMDQIVVPDVPTVTRWMQLPIEDQAKQAPDELILPHPRLQDRAFVLGPLCDVAPDWRHPVLKQTAREMLAALGSEAGKDLQPIKL